jgi:hypothetical protein
MQTSDFIASLALIVSVVSAAFSWWSAKEAAHARKITQSQELAPHFINVGYLWDLIMGQNGGKNELAAGKVSLKFLENQLSHDSELLTCLKKLPKWTEDKKIYGSFFTAPEAPYEIPVEAISSKEIFERKQREYLSIG